MGNTSLYKEEETRSKEDAFREIIWRDMLKAGAEMVQIHIGQSGSAWNAIEKLRKAIKYVDFEL